MRAFVDRFLPLSERRTAVWLALGGAAITWAASEITTAVWANWPAPEVDSSAGLYTVQVLAAFALVTILVAVMIRVFRAPAALAFYVVLGALLDVTLRVLGMPAELVSGNTMASIFEATIASALVFLGVAAGAVAGAWVAATVSMARIRDVGFSGDEDERSEGLRRKPDSLGWSIIGWTGRPLCGDSLMAVAFVAAGIIPSLAGTVFNLAMLPVAMGLDGDRGLLVMSVGTALLLPVAWFASAWLVTRRSGVVSVWMVPVGGLLMTVGITVVIFVQSGAVAEAFSTMWLNLLTAVLTPAAALLGSASALRAKPATLSASEDDGPQSVPPGDSTGGM